MKIKDITKIITIILLTTILLISFETITQATGQSGTAAGIIDPSVFSPEDITDADEAYKMAGTIVTTLSTVAMVVGIVGLMILGIKYMMGSVEEKAEYKKTLMPMLIGFIMIFAIGTIVKVIANITQNLSNAL